MLSATSFDRQVCLRDGNGRRKYLSEKERRRFFKKALDVEFSARMYALMLFYTGMRRNEAINLIWDNIDFYESCVVVRSLKKRELIRYRQIPLPEHFLKDLKILKNQIDINMKIWNFTSRTANRIINRIMNKAKIFGPQATPKGLRHSFAITCVLNKIPLTMIKKYMGHAALSTTAIYLDISGREERKVMSRLWKNCMVIV